MRTKIILILLFGMSFSILFAQNERLAREAFTLKLPVNETGFYEQKVLKSPYFVKENILQLYPGEQLFIEIDTTKNEIISMKSVKENINPKKTIRIEFTQTTKDKKSELMMLMIENPFDKDLEYKAMMFIVGHDKWLNTNVFPVKAKLTGYETWSDVIITLALSDWKFK